MLLRGHLVADGADAVEAGVAPVALHVGLRRVAHPAQHLDAQVGGLAGVLRGHHLGHVGLDAAVAALVGNPGGVVGEEFGLLAPHGDVGDVVLQDLEPADLAPEGLALVEVRHGVLEHRVEDAGAQGGNHDALVVERGEHAVETHAGLAHHVAVGHEHVVEEHLAGAHGAHAQLGYLAGLQSLAGVGHQEQRDAAGRLAAAVGGAGHQEQVVRHVRRRGPDLLAADLPAARHFDRSGLHGTHQVGAARGLGHRDRHADVTGRQLGDQLLADVLLGEGVDGLGAERGDTEDPGEPGEGAGQLAGQDHLREHVTPGPAEFFGEADGVEAGRRHLVPQLERVLELLHLDVAGGVLGALLVDPGAHRLGEEFLFLAE